MIDLIDRQRLMQAASAAAPDAGGKRGKRGKCECSKRGKREYSCGEAPASASAAAAKRRQVRVQPRRSAGRHARGMDDARLGAAFRAVRLRRRWRQVDVGARAGVGRTIVSQIERGHIDAMPLRTLRAVAAALDIRLDVVARWRGGELARLLNARHSALHESVADFFRPLSAWLTKPEVSFSIYGERGVIDLMAYHAPTGNLLVIELKTEIVDVNDLVGSVDRKSRLAPRIAADLGWRVGDVGRWVIVSRHKTNQRRIEAHRSMLRAAFPSDGHAMRSWLSRPSGPISALSMWTDAAPSGTSPPRGQRVRRPGSDPARR